MKSAEVVLFLALVAISVCQASDAGNELTNGAENSVTETVLNDTTVTDDPLEEPTTKMVSEDDSKMTDEPKDSAPNETEATVQPVTLSGGKKRLSTEVDESKCASLELQPPISGDCKCYQQKSAGTDTPPGFCYYYECAGNPPVWSKTKCEWVDE